MVSLQKEDVKVVLDGLGELPLKVSLATFMRITSQIDQSRQAAAAQAQAPEAQQPTAGATSPAVVANA